MIDRSTGHSGPVTGLFTLTLLLCPLAFLPLNQSFYLPRKTFLEIMLTLTLAVAYSSGKLQLRKSPFFVPWLLFLIIVFLSIFQGPSIRVGWNSFFFFAILATVCASIPVLGLSQKVINIFLIAIIIPGAINAVIGLLQYAGWNPIIFESVRFNVFGTLGSPAMLGGYLAVCILIAFHFFSRSQSKLHVYMWGVSIALFAPVITFTMSRSSMISAVAGFIVFAVFSLRTANSSIFLKRIFAAGLVAFVSISFFMVVLPGPGANTDKPGISNLLSGRKADSITQRQFIWTSSMELIKEHPLTGTGTGTFAYEYPIAQAKVISNEKAREYYSGVYGKRIAHQAHNDFIQLAVEIGVPGLAAFLLFPIIALFTISRKGTVHCETSSNTSPVIAGSIVALMAQAFFDFPLFMPASALLFWFFIGLSAWSPSATEESNPVRHRITANVSAFTIATLFCVASALPLASSYFLSRSEMLSRTGNVSETLRTLDTARLIYPASPEVHNALARIARRQGKYREAAEHYDVALSLSNNPTLFYGKGISEYMLGDYESAEKAFRTVISIDPSTANALGALGVILYEENNYNEAKRIFQEYLELRPGDAVGLKYMGLIDKSRNDGE